MAKAERENKKNPYELTEEESRYPGHGGMKWLKPIIVKQREGVKYGFRSQQPRNLPGYLDQPWRGQVWNLWLSTLSIEEQRVIRET